MIIFVGDKPSAKNIDPDIPFVGTQSYKRLLEWIWKMDIDISEVKVYNKDCLWLHNLRYRAKFEGYKVVCLGNESSKLFKDNDIPHFKLPHPSPKNRVLNDKDKVNEMLSECKKWIRKD